MDEALCFSFMIKIWDFFIGFEIFRQNYCLKEIDNWLFFFGWIALNLSQKYCILESSAWIHILGFNENTEQFFWDVALKLTWYYSHYCFFSLILKHFCKLFEMDFIVSKAKYDHSWPKSLNSKIFLDFKSLNQSINIKISNRVLSNFDEEWHLILRHKVVEKFINIRCGFHFLNKQIERFWQVVSNVARVCFIVPLWRDRDTGYLIQLLPLIINGK